ncbi:MAG: metalloregulator ArsR/SmtB family transcription factor [Candidatus Nanoarchaeia archaeon]|nr:metalloregulator ArsR/SmtB family transcription factor [Candidatus Nanoarchaeia archaeon]
MKCKSYYHFFEVIANKTRFKIIESLMCGPLNVGQICLATKEEQSKISHNLKVLSGCNVVDVKKDGKLRIYSLNKETVEPMLRLVEKHVQTYCEGNCGLK